LRYLRLPLSANATQGQACSAKLLNCQSVCRTLVLRKERMLYPTGGTIACAFWCVLALIQANPTATLLQKRFTVKLLPKHTHQAHGVEP